MFDLNADDGSVRRKAYKSPIPDAEDPRPVVGRKLDNAKNEQLHAMLLDHYIRELDRQADNRAEMAVDEDFYDNKQWRDEDAATLEERGQMPLVYNVISASVDWVIGSEKRARADYKVLPRRKQDSKPAERKSQILKYLSDCNRSPFDVSRAFADAVKVGVGWLEDGVEPDPEIEPIYGRHESWRNILYDSSANELDLSDGRYIFRSKWVDLDISQALFPKRKNLLRRSVETDTSFAAIDLYGDDAMDSQENELDQSYGSRRSDDVTGGYHRQRVRLIEAWFRIPVKTAKLVGGQFSGEIYDEHSEGHRAEIESGDAEIRESISMRMYVAIMTRVGLLYLGPSPYRHNRFPFTPIWGYRRGRDGLPYGMIRRLRDIQEDVNKRASKALYILSTNKTIMDKGAVDDLDEFMEEVARPDAVIVKNPGKELTINAERDLSQWHLELMSRSIAMIQQASGVTDELLGRRTNASSGIAIERRQSQGQMATNAFFDNLRFAFQVRGEKQLSLIEQFMTEEKAFRITNMRGTPEYITVNDGLPENDIVRSKADYVISEADWRATVRQAQTEELLDLLGKLAPVNPAIVMTMLDLVVESMDIPNREELVRRIRALTGQSDPDAEEPTPEEIQRAQAEAQNQQLQQGMLQAELRKKMADAAKAESQARQIAAKMVGDNVDAQQKALAAAREAITLPASTHVADHILAESGFKSQSDIEAEAEKLAGELAAQQQAAAAQEAAQQEQAMAEQAPDPDQSAAQQPHPQMQQPQPQPPAEAR